MSLLRSSFIVGSGTLLSRIFGYIRDICIAYFLGVGHLADAFFVASRLPNCFRSLFAEGAFSSAFVPIFSEKLSHRGKEQSVAFANSVMSFMLLVLGIFSVIVIFFMPHIMQVFAWGFENSSQQFHIVVELARITFPYLVLISLVALQSGVLNSLNIFGPPAITSSLLNICMIIALFTLTDISGSAAHALAWGMLISGIIQFTWLFFSNIKAGVSFKLTFPKLTDDIKLLLRKMVPGIIGSSATQLNVIINTILATLIPGGVSYLYYADRLVQFPMAIIGTAIGTALLPSLTKHVKTNKDAAARLQNKGLELAMLFTIPAAFALAVISSDIINIMFAHGKFNSEDIIQTSYALIAYAFGLPAFVLIKIFAPGFFARGNTKTPMKIALVSILLNITVSIALISWIEHVAMALATSLASILNAGLLYYILRKYNYLTIEKQVVARSIKILISSIIMSVMLLYIQHTLRNIFIDVSILYEVTYLLILIISGMATFFSILLILKCYKIKDIKKMIYNKS